MKVYGTGCKRCDDAEGMVKAAAATLGIEVAVEKVSYMAQNAMAGVMSTPGIAVDGKLVHTGGLPDARKLEEWLL